MPNSYHFSLSHLMAEMINRSEFYFELRALNANVTHPSILQSGRNLDVKDWVDEPNYALKSVRVNALPSGELKLLKPLSVIFDKNVAFFCAYNFKPVVLAEGYHAMLEGVSHLFVPVWFSMLRFALKGDSFIIENKNVMLENANMITQLPPEIFLNKFNILNGE